MRLLVAILLALFVLPLGLVTLVLDPWLGVSLYPRYVITVMGIAALLGAIGWRLTRHRAFLFTPVPIGLLLAVLVCLDSSPVKPAVRAVHRIRPGMTEAQVLAVLNRFFPEHGRFRRPNIGPARDGHISFVLDPSDGAYDFAIVYVSFEDGRCTGAEFLPD